MENSISYLLDQLSEIKDNDEEGLTEWCNQICEFYKEQSRHSYSDITSYILQDDGGIDYMYRVLPLLESAKSKLSDKESMEAKITKLIDHIKLELTRMKYLDKMREELNQSIVERYLELEQEKNEEFSELNLKVLEVTGKYTEMEARRSELEKKIEEMKADFNGIKDELKVSESDIKSIETLAKKTRHKLNNMQKEYITILGIFASIVIAFIGGTMFSTSVLQNIANASIYRISFISIGIAAVIINLIYILVRFIQELNKGEGEVIEYPRYMSITNIAILIGAVLVFVAWLFQLHPIVAQ